MLSQRHAASSALPASDTYQLEQLTVSEEVRAVQVLSKLLALEQGIKLVMEDLARFKKRVDDDEHRIRVGLIPPEKIPSLRWEQEERMISRSYWSIHSQLVQLGHDVYTLPNIRIIFERVTGKLALIQIPVTRCR
ncbi:hypothetical protein AcV7_003833 [Taiwanofungus camphoratus]|nr:hypothetical protein AcV7_003833 [Antrodia cinnamomea]